ncbi:MAG: hypothetical protein KatS3mg076_0566 [Candidatus Binatia bacterium]|nr:MAG: hypothetical protein KatS3mg076_0566 [Candidatus Binatia bacterium]
MARKRISEWARDWGVESRDIISALQKHGFGTRKAQSAMSEEEADRVRAELGLGLKPESVVGNERVVRDGSQTVVERRVRPNVIRRRAAQNLEPTPPPVAPPPAEPAPTGVVAPPTPAPFETTVPEITPPVPPPPAPEPPPVTPAAETAPPPAVEAREAEEVPPPSPQEPPLLSEDIQRPRVLGRVDLKKTSPEHAGDRAWAQKRTTTPPAPTPLELEDEAPRKKKKRVVKKDLLADFQDREYRPTKRPHKKKAQPGKEQKKPEITVPKASKRVVRISEVITVGELAKAMGVKAAEVIKKLMENGMMATINQVLDADTAALVASEFDYTVENVAFDAEQVIEEAHEAQPEEARLPRPPVVTVMGHVDHGKTSLLDAIRKTNVTAEEAGGITQHIGAYQVRIDGKQVTFLDTPGHEAFTSMRARGAKVTDIVVLVVAADDGVMPQTVEAINHARAADVPILVAINKIDKPDANPERVKQELANHGLVPEEWGGDTICVPVSAKTGEGLSTLLEMLLLQAEILDLRANPDKLARGTIIEARLDRGRGPVATVLVQEGTLKVGDPFVCGTTYGKVRAMMDDRGQRVDRAGPSMPVEILGLQSVPEAGTAFVVVADEATARQVAEHRKTKQREAELAKTSRVSLEDLYQRIQEGNVKELRVIVKADVQGSVEALTEALRRLSTDEVRLNVIHASVGGISESDVLLATASDAIIVGFHVRPESKASAVAEREGVQIRLYNVIYDVLNDVRAAMEGLLEPLVREKVTGKAEVRQVFHVANFGAVAGSVVVEGKISRGSAARLVRDHVVVYEGRIASLRRFKDDVREVASGLECGIGLENYSDIKVGDVIETYETERVVRRLGAPSPRSVGAEGHA